MSIARIPNPNPNPSKLIVSTYTEEQLYNYNEQKCMCTKYIRCQNLQLKIQKQETSSTAVTLPHWINIATENLCRRGREVRWGERGMCMYQRPGWQCHLNSRDGNIAISLCGGSRWILSPVPKPRREMAHSNFHLIWQKIYMHQILKCMGCFACWEVKRFDSYLSAMESSQIGKYNPSCSIFAWLWAK